jgi:UDP:flavonoid glycosyltransferase YjiC (YdhE family)
MAKILVTSHWTRGDVLPFLRLSIALKAMGHSVVFFSHGIFQELAAEAGLEFESWDEPGMYLQLLKDMEKEADPLKNPDEFISFTKKYQGVDACLKEMKLIQKYCNQDDTLLIARHRSSISSYLIAEMLGIKIIPVFLAPYYVTHLKSQELLFGTLMCKEVNRIRNELNLKPIESWLQWMSSIRNGIGLWPEWFQLADDDPAGMNIKPIGFFHPEKIEKRSLPEEVKNFIYEGDAPILITGGTSKLLNINFYNACIEACKQLNQKAIVVTQYKEYLPENLPSFIKHFDFLPIDTFMADLKAVIHHGGIGTASGAIYAGIPQLVLAADTDRPDNAMRIKKLGIGDYLHKHM